MIENKTDDSSEERDVESNYLIDRISEDEISLAYGLYTKLNIYEYHINNVQNKYKTLATTWILAAFIGIGYLLSGIEVGIPFSALLGIMFISLLCAEGIMLLWYLDSGVYHHYLEAVFSEALKLEKKYSLLGYSHQNMLAMIYKGKNTPTFLHGLYYSSFIMCLCVIAILAICAYIYQFNKLYVIVISGSFFFSLFMFKVLHKRAILKYETYKFVREHWKKSKKKK